MGCPATYPRPCPAARALAASRPASSLAALCVLRCLQTVTGQSWCTTCLLCGFPASTADLTPGLHPPPHHPFVIQGCSIATDANAFNSSMFPTPGPAFKPCPDPETALGACAERCPQNVSLFFYGGGGGFLRLFLLFPATLRSSSCFGPTRTRTLSDDCLSRQLQMPVRSILQPFVLSATSVNIPKFGGQVDKPVNVSLGQAGVKVWHGLSSGVGCLLFARA